MIKHNANGDLRINGQYVPLRRTDRLRPPAMDATSEDPSANSAVAVVYLVAAVVLLATAACCGLFLLALAV